MVRPCSGDALTTTWPLGDITPGVTIGSSWGENVSTLPSPVVTASRAGNAASASVIGGSSVVGAGAESIGAGAPLDCDAAAAPQEQSNNVTAMVVFMHV